MTRRHIASGSSFEADIAYSRAVVDGDWIFVSGTTGFDYTTMSLASGIAEQTEQCLRNIDAALREAGATVADVLRVRYIVPTFRWEGGAVYGNGVVTLRGMPAKAKPTNTAIMISAGLADARMRIEIEVTARKES